jgi:hypothetical protein
MKGFISYAHADHEAYGRFRTHLAAVERSLGIDFWADTRIRAGNYWNANIQAAIDAAHVHLLLISPSFLASGYIYDHELPAIRTKLLTGDLVIPVILKDCLWSFCVGPLQAVPGDGTGALKPVLSWRPQEAGFHKANLQVSEAIQAHFSIRPTTVF